jgi:hypothetical protein
MPSQWYVSLASEQAIFRPSPTEWADWVISGPGVTPIFAKCCCKALAINPGPKHTQQARGSGATAPMKTRLRSGRTLRQSKPMASQQLAQAKFSRQNFGGWNTSPLAFELADSGTSAIDFPR